ncbi:hypothetical protein [Joostella sp. CR20]|uniref:hypothetical protein n=1 Tax=Joostella sp. CR20 TaxID=2804312 RepID=UPI00313D4BA1
MSSLSSIYIKKETLKKLLEVVEKKGDNGVNLTVSLNNETNDYGQNLSAWVSQSKEDREAGKSKYYVGNGKCFWTDGSIVVAEKKEAQATPVQADSNDDDLPF